MSKKTLSSLKVDVQTIENMKSAIKKYNQNSLASLNENEFRRLAYELLSQLILQDKPIPVRLNSY